MNALQKRLTRNGVQAVLALSAWVARQPKLNALTDRTMRAMAAATVRAKGIREARDLEDLGRQWQRGFPSAKQVPITAVTDDTVFAEIQTPCPLRDSGDTQACWRMMQYDRSVAGAAGGEFMVLRSQAQPGVTVCQVALRRARADWSDLAPAHEATP